MTLYIGVDIHPYQQTVAYSDTMDGEIKFQTFKHKELEKLKKFYGSFKGDSAIVGVEATGGLEWFEEMIFDNGHKLLVGNPHEIRRRAMSRHKSDRRDAETILDLLMKGEFPQVWRRDGQSRITLELLRFRQNIVRQRTSVANQLQALARKQALPRFTVSTKKGRNLLLTAKLSETDAWLRDSLCGLYDTLTERIGSVEERLRRLADGNEAAKQLMTHSGIGFRTALALTATLGDVSRFGNMRQVTAFVGLDPLNKSTGEKQRIGRISKHGSRLCRHLLGQAAARSQDKRIRAAYSRIKSRRGHAVAKVAAARRILLNCYIMLRDGIDYAEFTRRGEVGLHEITLA
ncbi:MAG: IS110 family transposase [Pyrinomonadaceae bacterium]